MVRVAVNELRKRLAQFYEVHPDSAIHIELPRGCYVPVFNIRPMAEPVAAPVSAPELPPASPRRKLWGYAAAGVAVIAAASLWIWLGQGSAEEAFWRPVLVSRKPALIWATGWGAVMDAPVKEDILKRQSTTGPYLVEVRPDNFALVDQVTAFGQVHAISTLSSWLAERRRPPQLRLGNWQTPSDVHDQPLILLGALNNPWTIDLTRDLRFEVKFVGDAPCIVDKANNNRAWTVPAWGNRGYDVTIDYSLITRVIDKRSGQVRISIGGISHYASQAGAEFLTSPKYWTEIDHVAPKGWQQMNLQVVLEMRVVEKAPEDIRAVAWHFW
jgi:hypothetical protein